VKAVAGPVAGVTVAALVVLAIHPVDTDRIAAGYVLALAAVGVGAFLRVLRERETDGAVSQFEHALAREPERPMRPPELVRVEREITLGTTSAGHLHRRLVPLLRDAAVARLGTGFTRERVGDRTWELLRPDRPEPEDRTAPGISLKRVREVVAQLETL